MRLLGWPRMAKAAAIAGVISLSVTVAALVVLLPAAIRGWERGDTSQFEWLQSQLFIPETVSTLSAQPLDEGSFSEDLVAIAEAFRYSTVSDPWLLPLVFVGYLQLRGVPLWLDSVGGLCKLDNRRHILVRDGDTWGSLADQYLSDTRLWPLLMALNFDYVRRNGAVLATTQSLTVPGTSLP